MADTVSDLARRLAENAEAVCRYYLFNGRRQGGYWLVGDVHNAPGRSLYVRLQGPNSGKGAAGKWTDAADGGHGDLLDLIGAVRGLQGGDLLDEARPLSRAGADATGTTSTRNGRVGRSRTAAVRDGTPDRGHAG